MTAGPRPNNQKPMTYNKVTATITVLAVLVAGFVLGVLGTGRSTETLGGTTYDASRLVGDVYQGLSEVLMFRNGEFVGPIDTDDAASFDAAVSLDAVRVDEGLIEGGGVVISTTSATYTLTQAEMQDVKVIVIASTALGEAITLTLPATSTMTTMIPNAYDTQEWIIDNLHTSAATTSTFAAGTGIDIDGTGANDDVINGGVSGRLVCTRLLTTDVRCIIEEFVDAG